MTSYGHRRLCGTAALRLSHSPNHSEPIPQRKDRAGQSYEMSLYKRPVHGTDQHSSEYKAYIDRIQNNLGMSNHESPRPGGSSSDTNHAGDEDRDIIVGRTHSRTKYSWKRSSLVSSGWNVVSRCRPCRSATIVRGSRGSVSSSSIGTTVCDAGRREGDMREMICIGGSVGDGLSPITT